MAKNNPKYEYVVGDEVTREQMKEFWFTRSGSTNPPTFQRYEILCEDGKWFLYHEKREGDHWPLEESDVTVSGKIELTTEECDKIWEMLSGGKVMRRKESTEAGGAGPWLYLYWKEDAADSEMSEFQEYYFESYAKQQEFEEWCAAKVNVSAETAENS